VDHRRGERAGHPAHPHPGLDRGAVPGAGGRLDLGRHPPLGRVGALVQLDAATGAVRGELRDIDIPARIEVGFGSVWVTDSGGSSVFRVDA
jgi:hypothetical protein